MSMRAKFIGLAPILLCVTSCGKNNCERIVNGPADISSSADVDRFACTETINGHVWVENSNLAAIELPQLKTVGGNFIMQTNFALTTVELPTLQSVGGEFHLKANPLTTLTVPSLTAVGTLNWRDLRFATLNVPALTQTTADFDLTDCNGIHEAQMPSLTMVGGDFVLANTTISSVGGFGKLSEVGGAFVIENNSALAECLAEALEQQVATQVGIGGAVTMVHNTGTGFCP
jgi:hypothetical protein